MLIENRLHSALVASGVSPNLEVNISPEVLVVTPWVFDATNEGVRSSGSSYAEPSKKMFGVLFECFRKLLAKFLADDSLPILHSTCHHQVTYLDKGDMFCHYDLSI
jgi:hypothetical protein